LPDLKGFGEALNDCAPERYASLPPEKKVRCPHPGEGMAQQGVELDLTPKVHAKDEALWQEDWDEKHWTAGLCDHSMEGLVASCMIHQAIGEAERAADVRYHLAKTRTEAVKPRAPKIPEGARGAAPER
jgi:hypothetical protein